MDFAFRRLKAPGSCLLLKATYNVLSLKTRISVRASLIAQLVKNPPAVQETWFDSWVRKICWRRERLPTPVF